MADSSKKGSLAVILSLIGVGLVIIAGVSYYLISQYKKLTEFCVKFLKSQTKINNLGLNKTDITLLFQLLNKSSINAIVDGYQFEIYVNDTRVSTAYSQKPITVNANGYSVIEVNVIFNPLQVLQIGIANIGDLISRKENIVIRIEGKLLGVKSVIKVNEIPLSYLTNLKELTSDDTKDDETDCK